MRLPPFRSLAVNLALAAMLLRALLPDGWMPGAEAATPFVICSVDGGHGTGKTAPSREPRSHGPCAFAAAAPLSPPPAVAVVAGLSGPPLRLAGVFADAPFFTHSVYRPNTARAPPAFS